MLSNVILSALMVCSAPPADCWPEFRGPRGDGHADATGLPLKWSETENVRWKTAIHDRGWSSPVVWGNQIWVTTATKDGTRLFAVCVDRESGNVVHDVKVFDVEKPEKIAPVNSYASPTPAIEEGRLYAHYGTYGTACLDTRTGKVLWTRRDLNCDHHEGPGASVTLFENLLIFHVDGCDVQYIVALDKATGRTVWQTRRSIDYSRIHPFTRKAFATPIVVDTGKRLELISPCSRAIIGYNPRTGEELWKIRHPGWSIAVRPMFADGLVFFICDYEQPQLWAVRPGGSGDVTDTHVVWKAARGMPQKPSPVLIGDRIYAINDTGIAACVEARTGKMVWQQRLGGDYSASLLYADGRIHAFSHDATCRVLAPGPECKVLAVNKLDGRVMATPAAAGKALFVRTEMHLYRIEAQP